MGPPRNHPLFPVLERDVNRSSTTSMKFWPLKSMNSVRITAALLIALLTIAPSQSQDQAPTSRWGASYFPDYTLTNHHGEQMRFFSDLIKDKIVVINFIYTSCPDTCPLETSRLREVYSLLENRMGKDIFFYSISIDPDHDTVAVLKGYAERWEVGPGWTFLTGKESEINDLRKKFGLLSSRDSVNLSEHQVNMVMGNQKTGRWIHRTPFDSPSVLTEHLGTWLNNYRNVKTTWNDYADAPELRQVDGGEYIFRTRCASCHTIGGGAVMSHSPTAVGPDLLAVGKRRDPAWLARWIREPDVMIEEKDELALALLKQYNGVAMPNFRLTETDVERVLEFIEKETEFHLNGHASEFKKAIPMATSAKPKGGCAGCSKEEPESDPSKPTSPRTWNSARRKILPAKSSN
jgi:protein SCO1